MITTRIVQPFVSLDAEEEVGEEPMEGDDIVEDDEDDEDDDEDFKDIEDEE